MEEGRVDSVSRVSMFLGARSRVPDRQAFRLGLPFAFASVASNGTLAKNAARAKRRSAFFHLKGGPNRAEYTPVASHKLARLFMAPI